MLSLLHEILSGRQLRQDVFFDVSGTNSVPSGATKQPAHPENGERVSSWNVRKLVLSNKQHIMKMGMELVPETSENLHILMQLSAPENFIEFCWHESF